MKLRAVFVKINNIDKTLATIIKEKRTQINRIWNEK